MATIIPPPSTLRSDFSQVLSPSRARKIVLFGPGRKTGQIIALAAILFLLEAATQVILHRNHLHAEYALAYLVLGNYAIFMALQVRRLILSRELKAHWSLCLACSAIYSFFVVWDLWAQDFFPHTPTVYLASCMDLILLCPIIPSFLLISLPAGRRYFRHFIWIDTLLAAMAAYLLYIVILRVPPFSSTPTTPSDRMFLVRLLTLSGLCFAAGMVLHYFAAINLNEKRFFGVTALGIWYALVVNAIFNPLIVLHPSESLYNIPLLSANLLACVLLALLAEEVDLPQTEKLGPLADLINIASPSLSSAALLVLGIAVVGRYLLRGWDWPRSRSRLLSMP